MNLSRARIVLAILATIPAWTNADQASASIRTMQAPELLAIAQRVLDYRQPLSEIWPGYWPTDQSFIILEPAVGYVRVSQGDAPRFHEGTLEGADRPFIFDFPTGPPNTIFVKRRGEAQDTWRTLFHEQFHDFQDDRFTGGGGNRGEFVDLSNVADRVALTADLELERRVLAAAIRADAPAAREDLARRYLALRRDRETVLDEPIIATERARERYEGSADYARLRAIDILTESGSLQQQILAKLEESLLSGGGSYMSQWFRERAYGVGAAIGILLDRMGFDWQQDLERGVPFDVLLERQLGKPDQLETQRLAAETRQQFGRESVLAEVRTAFAAGPPQMTEPADFYALAKKRLVLDIASGPSGTSGPRLQFSASMNPVSPTAMVLINVQSLFVNGDLVSLETSGAPALIDHRDSAGDRPGGSVYTLMLDDFTGLGHLGDLPPGDTRLDNLTFSGEDVTIKIDRPVLVSVGIDEIKISVE